MQIFSEGVFVLASAKALLREYQDQEFDYNFPEGLTKLLDGHMIIAATTENGDDLFLEFEQSPGPETKIEAEFSQFLRLEEGDDLLVMNHGEFTMICDGDGDYRNHFWPITKIENLQAGLYKVHIQVENVADRIIEFGANFRLFIQIEAQSEAAEANHVRDLLYEVDFG